MKKKLSSFYLSLSSQVLLVIFSLLIGITIYFYLSTALSFMDPDLGWHLRFGELVLAKGIPKTDPFSYSMPSYPFVNHEWLTDILLTKVYSPQTVFVVAAFFALIAISAILLQFATIRVSPWTFFLFSCTVYSLKMFVGIRPQVLSWFFFSLIFFLLSGKKRWHKYRFFIPFLFLLWANLHGAFPMGLALLGLYSAIQSWNQKKIIVIDTLLFFFSFFFTFINPYGVALWKEIFVSIVDPSLRWSIQEWLPSFATANLILWAYVPTSALLVFLYWKKLPRENILIYCFFLLAGLSSVRHMPFWLILSIPITAQAAEHFYETVKNVKGGVKRLQATYSIILGFLAILYILHRLINQYSIPRIDEVYYYPANAVFYLRTHMPRGNIFSFYGWGGYLIWKIPEKKVFVDGRMPSWKQTAKPGESSNAFKEHNEIFEGEYPLTQAIDKYHITAFLLPREKTDKKKKEKQLLSFLGKTGEKVDIYEQLKKIGWKVTYKDNTAVIYQR